MAVSEAPVTERKLVLPDPKHPIAYIDGRPIYLDPVWRRFLQEIADRQAAAAVLINAVRAEVNLRHP